MSVSESSEMAKSAAHSRKPRATRFLDLPVELIIAIEEQILLDEDLSCLIRTCRPTYIILNFRLYQRSSRTHNFAILWAARTGSVKTLTRALVAGADASAKASGFIQLVTDVSRHRRSPTFGLVHTCHEVHGKTPLILAAAHGYTNILRVLLQDRLIRVRLAVSGMTAIHWAAFNGHASAVRLLLSYTKNWGMLGRTPMHLAAKTGHHDVVLLLLKQKSREVNTKDPFGLTALHLAARNGHTAIVRALLEHRGTDVSAVDFCGRTPYQLAMRNGHELTAEVIFSHHRTEFSIWD